MSPLDFLYLGIPLLAGFMLLSRFFRKAVISEGIHRYVNEIYRIHKKAQWKLAQNGAFPFPGGMLVTSLRGWFAGEAVWVSVIVISVNFDPSPAIWIGSFFLGMTLGFLVVSLSLREQAKYQLDRIRSALPFASFLLSLLLESGMGSHSALQEVARALPNGPLATELEDICRSRFLGIQRAEALDRSRKRVPLDDYRIFLNLIQQGERLGLGLSRGLREHSAKMMEGEGFRAEAVAQKAAVKLLFPLVVFIFPAVTLIIFSPIILNLWEMWGQ